MTATADYTAADGSVWRVEYDPPPIPVNCFDYHGWLVGGEGECVFGRTPEDVVEEIEVFVEERP